VRGARPVRPGRPDQAPAGAGNETCSKIVRMPSSRFPFPTPFGWFQVAFPGDLAPGEVTALEYWNRDLVLWRDEAGDFHLQDAFCPHLGAHLAYGGTVHRDQLQCPFHGWRFDGGGACTNIPYSQRTNRKATLRAYPVVVRNGFVLAWYHPFDEAPLWEIPVIPEIGDLAWSDFTSSSYVIRTIPQEMNENGVDPAHFQFVHGTDTVAEMERYETDGPCSVMLSKQTFVTPRGVTEAASTSTTTVPACRRCGSRASSTRSTSRPRHPSTTRPRRYGSTSPRRLRSRS